MRHIPSYHADHYQQITVITCINWARGCSFAHLGRSSKTAARWPTHYWWSMIVGGNESFTCLLGNMLLISWNPCCQIPVPEIPERCLQQSAHPLHQLITDQALNLHQRQSLASIIKSPVYFPVSSFHQTGPGQQTPINRCRYDQNNRSNQSDYSDVSYWPPDRSPGWISPMCYTCRSTCRPTSAIILNNVNQFGIHCNLRIGKDGVWIFWSSDTHGTG